MNIEEIENRYELEFSDLFRKLWSNGMLDWMNGRTTPFKSNENWEKTIYPQIKENPPLLLHAGGFDFEMLRAEDILNFKFDELWDIENHHFVPFAKTDEGNIYAFYKNLKKNNEYVVVYIWNDMNETEIIAKNFEDFVFRKMLEAIFDVDKDDLKGDYRDSGFSEYQKDLRCDLKTIKPYIKKEYGSLLSQLYDREAQESIFSYSLISKEELIAFTEKYLGFEELDSVFEHELK